MDARTGSRLLQLCAQLAMVAAVQRLDQALAEACKSLTLLSLLQVYILMKDSLAECSD